MKLSATVQICIWEHSEEPVTVLINFLLKTVGFLNQVFRS